MLSASLGAGEKRPNRGEARGAEERMQPHQAGFWASHVQVLTPRTSELTVFGDRTFKEGLKVKGGH